MTKQRTAFSILLLVLLASCAVHRPRPIDLPATLAESYAEEAASGARVGEWWKAFQDEELNRLMEEAFSNNLDLEQSYARLDQAGAVYRTHRAAELPALNGKGEWSREDTPGFFGNNSGNSHRYSLAAAFELDLWQKLRSRSKAASLDLEASKADLEAVYVTLSAQVADAYSMLAEQRAQLELTDRTISSFLDTAARVERRYQEGLVPALDFYQARQNLAGAKSRRPLFESALARAEHELALLLGRYPKPGAEWHVVTLPEISEAFPAGLPSELLARRPDVEAALRRLKASDARIAAAAADRFPSFNLLGNWGDSSAVFSTGDIEGAFWNILVNAVLPIMDGGRRRAEVKRTQAVFRENLAGYHKAVLTAFKEVEDALVRNRTSEERIARLAEKVDAAEASLRLSLERYLQGLSDYLPVLTAQGAHFDAESELLAARRQLISDRISLARSLGGEWMAEKMKERKAGRKAEDRRLRAEG